MLKSKIEKTVLTDDELMYMECMHNPKCLLESYFHNFDSLGSFDEDLFGDIRMYQIKMLSYESMVDTKIKGLTDKQRFNMRKNLGDCIAVGARLWGKTLICLKLDIMHSAIHCAGEQVGFTSESGDKIRTVLDDVRQGLEEHPFYKIYNVKARASGGFNIRLNNGFRLIGINMDVTSKKAGKQFFGKHYDRLYIEESSLETEQVYKQRKDSVSEIGCVIRSAGMTNFVQHSPAGKQFYSPANRMKTVYYPQYVNSRKWDIEEKKEKIRDFDGQDSFNYRVFVGGEILRDGISEMDMDRIQYRARTTHKIFELKKVDFCRFRRKIVVERPKNADSIWINADVGDGRGGSEIIVYSKVGNVFVYLYNIRLWNWIEEEQEELMKWLGSKLGVNVFGVDCGDALGRGLFRSLEKQFGKDIVVRYAGNDKVIVDYEKKEDGELVREKGKPIPIEETMANWSFETLRKMLYGNILQMGIDYKLHKQLENVVSIQSADGSRRRYMCSLEDDHLYDAHRVFANSYWQKEGVTLEEAPVEWGLGSNGSTKKRNRIKSNSKWGIGSTTLSKEQGE